MGKIISLICAMIVALTSFTACKGEEQTSSESTASVAVQESEAVDTTTTAPEAEPETEVYESRYQLSNPNADVNARKLYDYINDVYGTAIITAQQESTWMGSPDYEMDYIFEFCLIDYFW